MLSFTRFLLSLMAVRCCTAGPRSQKPSSGPSGTGLPWAPFCNSSWCSCSSHPPSSVSTHPLFSQPTNNWAHLPLRRGPCSANSCAPSQQRVCECSNCFFDGLTVFFPLELNARLLNKTVFPASLGSIAEACSDCCSLSCSIFAVLPPSAGAF